MLMQILIWLLLNLTLSLKLRELFAKMIKKYDLPYTFAVYDYVRHWLACVCSTYNIDTRSAIVMPKSLNKRRRSSIQTLKTILHVLA